MSSIAGRPLGGTLTEEGASFLIWAPLVSRVDLLLGDGTLAMTPAERGYHFLDVPDAAAGDRYAFSLDAGPLRPDPASRYQPDGVHAASELIGDSFDWQDEGWRGLPLDRHVIYELHVGTFTAEGTLDAVIPHLDYLHGLGVTAIEIMPVAQFPGARNWGYDGVLPFAVQNSYGGPEGNYLSEFGPYFTDRYKTPWGAALNFDGPGSDEVRRYFIESARYYVRDCHLDGLRLDALHAIVDHTAVPFVEELGAAVHEAGEELGRSVHLFAESTQNDPRLVTPREVGGVGLDAVWNDDFHHALRASLTGDRSGYYADYGEFKQVAKAYDQGFVYSGEYSAFHGRRRGRASAHLAGDCFVAFAGNHDQVGNRPRGERLSQIVDFETLKLAAGAVILAPYIPLLFMGEEYAETSPFQYFIDHSEPELIEAVRQGRRREFESFGWSEDPLDPYAEETFRCCILDHSLRRSGEHQTLLRFYQALLALRKNVPALANLDRRSVEVDDAHEPVLIVRRRDGSSRAAVVFNFGDDASQVELELNGACMPVLVSASEEWGGPGSGLAAGAFQGGKADISLPRRSFAVLVSGKCED